MTPCYLFDIDGTLADITHRLKHIQKEPKDWDSFFADCPDDRPIPHIIELAQDLMRAGKFVIFVSGRSDQVRLETLEWLYNNVGASRTLYMRKAGDHRPDHIVKAELLDQIVADDYEPIMAFDDRNQVVEMWRAKGLPCAQVADGNF